MEEARLRSAERQRRRMQTQSNLGVTQTESGSRNISPTRSRNINTGRLGTG